MKNYFIIIMLILVSSSFAQNKMGKTYNPLSSKSSIGLDGGITIPKTDFKKAEIDYIVRLVGDYYFTTYDRSIFGISIAGSFGYAAGSGRPGNMLGYPPLDEFRTQVMTLSGGASYTLTSWNWVYPYIASRIGWIHFQPRDVDGDDLERNSQNKYSPIDWFVNGELGLKFPISNSASFNIAGTMDYLPFDNLDDAPNSITNGTEYDIFFTLTGGFQYYLGGVDDSDNDGVNDEDDLCPDTPPFVKVDEFGCPLDTDNDGVPDYIDNCPNTPKNVIVDQEGCPLDVDGDGVPDYLDLCPGTPEGVQVDSRGCPADSDEDGIPDYKDLCPNTPVGTEVNKWGCPIEETVVETPEPEIIEYILSGGVTFETNKADLLQPAFIELDKVIKVMKDRPETKWKIEGHTDNTGSYKRNKELSLQRAQSVYNYFIRNGIAAARLQVNGYGSDYPIADNFTETGKAMNRRVAITLLTKDNSENTNGNKNQFNTDTRKVYDSALEKQIGNMVFTDGNLYCFQVSSWRTREKAEAQMNQLINNGIKSFVVAANSADLDGTWYRVRVGYFDSLEELNIVKAKVSK